MDLGKIAYDAWRQSREDGGREEYMPWDEMSEHARSAWQAAAQAVRDASPWILVDERMPDEGMVVLAHTPRLITPYQLSHVGSEDWWHEIVAYVTHWMPLPEAPQ